MTTQVVFDAPIMSTRPEKITTTPISKHMRRVLDLVGQEWSVLPKTIPRITLWAMENRGLIERRYVDGDGADRRQWRRL